MFSINGWEWVILIAMFVIVFGPESIPETAVQLGKLLRRVQQYVDEATADISRELHAAARQAERARADVGQAVSEAVAQIDDSRDLEADPAAPAPTPAATGRPELGHAAAEQIDGATERNRRPAPGSGSDDAG